MSPGVDTIRLKKARVRARTIIDYAESETINLRAFFTNA